MSRKHFAAIAEALRLSRLSMSPEAYKQLVTNIAYTLSTTNSNFNHQKFIDAAYKD